MAKEMSKIADDLKRVLKNEKYNDNYGGSIIFTITVVCIVSYVIINNFVDQKKQMIKSDWKKLVLLNCSQSQES